MKQINIAIDGPAASGKSTTARIVAEKLGYLYIDTGAMYRALTLAVLRRKIDPSDSESVYRIAKSSKIELKTANSDQRTFLNGEDVSKEIRLPEISRVISVIAAYSDVRSIMVEKQRFMAQNGGIVMDGRDIGTVVLPQAEVKIFMKAGISERAQRRFDELQEKGVEVNLQNIEKEIELRDRHDSSRSVAPLKPANDAIVIDTSHLSIDQQVEKVLAIVEYRLSNRDEFTK